MFVESNVFVVVHVYLFKERLPHVFNNFFLASTTRWRKPVNSIDKKAKASAHLSLNFDEVWLALTSIKITHKRLDDFKSLGL